MENPENSQAVYFTSLTLENVKCFKGEHHIPLTNAKGEWAQWTVILGNNNTGKTTILRCLEGMRIERGRKEKYFDSFTKDEELNISSSELEDSFLSPSFVFSRKAKEYLIKGLYADNTIVSSTILIGGEKRKWYYEMKLSTNDKGKVRLAHYYPKSEAKEEGYFPLEVYPYSVKRSYGLLDFDVTLTLPEVEPAKAWLAELFLARATEGTRRQAEKILEKIRRLILSGILPDVKNFELHSEIKGSRAENHILFETDFGKVRLEEMGYGYQTSLAWIMDLARRMFERYPEAENPLEQPAVVLVDELDLHLHPQWQRKIINHLSKHFPKTQFIVTAHSPLLVQSAEDVNVIVLQKNEEGVSVKPFDIHDFRGWSVEEILRELMELEDKVHSDLYLKLMDDFVEGLNDDDYKKTKKAYDALCEILHPISPLRSTLDVQMISLTRPLS